MRLSAARVRKYRSIRDTGWFDVEDAKTILVGPNEAGKTAILQALQQINPPEGVRKFEELRDYPRSEYNDISTGKVMPANVTVASARFELDENDKAAVPEEFWGCKYVLHRRLDNSARHELEGGASIPKYSDIAKDLQRLVAHVGARVPAVAEGATAGESPSEKLVAITGTWSDSTSMVDGEAQALGGWLKEVYPLVEEDNEQEERRYERLLAATKVAERRSGVLDTLFKRLPLFVLFSNYFRVKPRLHLEHLAQRIEQNVLDDDAYDYGNLCLLKLLGFTPRQLADLGRVSEPPRDDPGALKTYHDQLDRRSYQLNAASVRLTNEIRSVWVPDAKRAEADQLRVTADSQYLKVVVVDDLGVEIELDQRSEGFQWLVSFFVVFFSEAQGKHANAILLLDEPGLNLHGLKQREFRNTLSRLSEHNQTLYTTHSPFLVGPDELDLVRVVEMVDRHAGTKVHNKVIADDPGALLPLQEALGYDLAQSLFSQARNLVLEGLTDLWYIDSVAQLLRDAKIADLNEKVSLVPASTSGKVVYYATILHSQKLKVAALLDSDAAGDQAAQQDVLVNALGNKGILRTKDFYSGEVTRPEMEDMLRDTLITIAKDHLGWDVSKTAIAQPKRPIVDVFTAEIGDFSKYKLAKEFIRWTRAHEASDLSSEELRQWEKLITTVNRALK
ncbi:MAG: OLD family endonuclease [Betaproteobacteria bacterium HGW-Betaproteobacteria-13]|nr:MAG: OLD family endonuclease [Betaproteobacteria bacterium HGW-Betaproteobacteria-13]